MAPDYAYESGADSTASSQVSDRGQRLFRFLAEAQRLKHPAVIDARNYESIFWAKDFPDHPAVRGAFQLDEPEDDTPILIIDRLPVEEPPPQPPENIVIWLDGPINRPDKKPTLHNQIDDPDSTVPYDQRVQLQLADHSPVRDAYHVWIAQWSQWAEQIVFDRPVRDLYKRLFSTASAASARQEELEVVLGLGLLDWQPDKPATHNHVSRHVLACPLTIGFDDHSGTITVSAQPDTEQFRLELEMLQPELVKAELVNDMRSRIQGLSGNPLQHDETGDLIRSLVLSLSADAGYSPSFATPARTGEPRAAFAPAIILRKRSSRGLIQVFEQMAHEVARTQQVPDGLMPLIDPDFEIPTETDPSPGAICSVDDDDEVMLPLPLNDKQLQVVQRANTRAQTLVQGPPGTGKTHTAAALMSHLLAQGKRVLVTSQTDRALKEVRSKLPEPIQPLAVSVVGANREEFGNLKAAVDGLSRRAFERDSDDDDAADRDIGRHLTEIDRLRRLRAETRQGIVRMRKQEVTHHEHAGSSGTLSTIAQQHQRTADQHQWLLDYAAPDPDGPAPLNSRQAERWLALLGDTGLRADESDARLRIPELDDVPSPEDFAAMVDAEAEGASAAEQHEQLRQHAAYQSIAALPPETRTELQQRMRTIMRQARDLEGGAQTWMNQALPDIRSGRDIEWRARAQTVSELIEAVQPIVERVHPATTVWVEPGSDIGALANLAFALYNHIQETEPIKTNQDGSPKIGVFTSKTVKNSKQLFDAVRVDGQATTSAQSLSVLLNVFEGRRQLDALDRAWPATVVIPEEDTLRERLQWHATELSQLQRILNLGDSLTVEQHYLADIGLPRPDWNNVDSVLTYAQLVDAAATDEQHAGAAEPLDVLAGELISLRQWQATNTVVDELATATAERNTSTYGKAYERLVYLHDVRRRADERDGLKGMLAQVAPELAKAVTRNPDEENWTTRLDGLAESWAWAQTDAWLRSGTTGDMNAAQAKLDQIEQRIRHEVEALASARAWRHASAPTRLTGRARADLAHYSERVRKLGKGTGKYAPQRRAEVREAMNRCRSAVPAWIMPLYRITEQLQVAGNMFDVVIVDEASQAGLEAAFLLHLAPKVIVIGDDKQVSPVAIRNLQSIRELANQYLYDNPYKSSWQDPELSLFDLCVARFGARITLVEHRRCVPEIIEFSNQIAYVPEGIRLLPVRQYGTDRLEPIQVVHVADGYEKGRSGANVNEPEADAIVEQIQKCLADPAYDDRTIGVISLVGSRQAQLIESKLTDIIANEEWTTRDLRCGDATDFQGSERDVMFLSMVSAPDEGRKMGALTRELNMQRFNVATSRAKDQLWVFHTATLHDLPNKEDMRHRLLDYCYGVVNRHAEGESPSMPVPDDEIVEPFDSLFEQRVYNRIVERGFTVEPQVDANGYRIDLVVVGGAGRLAIECDGDWWHGPDAYLRDLARQRDLERCGWTFFRIRESEWYTDEGAVLSALWEVLDSHQIYSRFTQEHAPHDVLTAEPEVR